MMAERPDVAHRPEAESVAKGCGVDSELNGHCLVAVIDDDESVRESLPDLLREFGYAVQAFASADEFLASGDLGRTRCLILDVAMPGMSGPELQRELKRRDKAIPVVFITAYGDETVRLRLLQQGAVDCLFKPFSETALVAALDSALRVA
jgi:FixJ family two-component response regulator